MEVKLSIIVPVYNVENYLDKCIKSILGQSFEDFELILINDGSTDRSGEICDKYCKVDSRVKVIHQDNNGQSAARNRGLEISSGMYIGFVDSDDWIDSEMYSKMVSTFEEDNYEVIICSTVGVENEKCIYKNKSRDKYIMNNETLVKEFLLGDLYRASLCDKLFKKSLFENIKFPEGKVHEDLEVVFKILCKSKKGIFINYNAYYYRVREGSTLRSCPNKNRLYVFDILCNIYYEIRNSYPDLFNEFIFSLYIRITDYLEQCIRYYNSEDSIKALMKIKEILKKYIFDIIKNPLISFKQKVLLSSLLLSYKIYVFNIVMIKKYNGINTSYIKGIS